METALTTLLLAEPNTTWVNATFSWATTNRPAPPSLATGGVCPTLSQRFEFSALGESYCFPTLRRLGATR